eukprot:6212353-Pleurochrysis_carterae.AAC.1
MAVMAVMMMSRERSSSIVKLQVPTTMRIVSSTAISCNWSCFMIYASAISSGDDDDGGSGDDGGGGDDDDGSGDDGGGGDGDDGSGDDGGG